MLSNIILNENCKIVNIVWIDRGILLTIIYFLLKFYSKLENNIIIINNSVYRTFLRELFPEFRFEKYTKHRYNNFYFNIRETIMEQDIFINYINMDKISAKKLYLVPWYDMNEPLIAYCYNEDKELKTQKYKDFFINFGKCRRGNYFNMIWDLYIENYIFKKYNNLKLGNIQLVYNLFNNYIAQNYKPLYYNNQYPSIYYINLIKENQEKISSYEEQIKKLEIKNDDNVNFLINLLNDKIKLINNFL